MSGDAFCRASVRERIAAIDRIRGGLREPRHSQERYVVPTSLRPAFEAALESLRKPYALRAVPPGRLPGHSSDAAWARGLLDRYLQCTTDTDLLPYGGLRVALLLLRCRLRDALDLLSPPQLPSGLDRDAHLELAADPGLRRLAAWWAPRLSADATGVVDQAKPPRACASGTGQDAVSEVGDFHAARCETLVQRLIGEGDTDGAWALLCAVRAEDDRNLPTMNSYAMLIQAFGEEHRGLRAGQVFERMQGLFPQAMSDRALAQQGYDEILMACGRSQDFARSLRHARAMRRCGCRFDTETLAKAIVACIACKDLREARCFLDEGRKSGVPIRACHVIPLVEAFAARGGDREQAGRIIQESLDRNEGVFTPHLGLTGHVLDVRQVFDKHGSTRRWSAASRDLISTFIDFHDRRGMLGDRFEMILELTDDGAGNLKTRSLPRWNGWRVLSCSSGDHRQLRLQLVRPPGYRSLSDP